MGYDRTVRDSDQSVIQFHFGEDGLDVAQTPYLNKTQFNFIKENSKIYQKQLWGNREIPSLSSEVAALQKHKESYIKLGLKML
jgi:DNA-directed RNA polymerase I subunit RPA1